MGRIDDLARELAALGDRVAALETPAPGAVDAALLNRLQRRTGPESEGAGDEGGMQFRGAVQYAGAATLAGQSYLWQMERPVPGVLSIDDELIAGTLAAAASPTRVRLLKAVLRGARESAELQSALGGVSTGQLYHHLRELVAAGLVVQRGRGRYEVAAHAVVPLLAVFAAVFDLATPASLPPPEGLEDPAP